MNQFQIQVLWNREKYFKNFNKAQEKFGTAISMCKNMYLSDNTGRIKDIRIVSSMEGTILWDKSYIYKK